VIIVLLAQLAGAGLTHEPLANATVSVGSMVAEAREPRYRVEVSVSRCKLTLFDRQDETGLYPVREYTVGTASKALSEAPLGKGTVVGIELNPTWIPTEYTRAIYRQRGIELPPTIPPGDPLNYMGPFKIVLSHRTSRGTVYRIHGNNAPERVGKRVTGGCICMNNAEGLELAAMLSVGTEVNITP
jgi:lipoprotein-anchoring transpeptidase ErfK/SrfK